ncbi:MAG: SHOCT domain-containing protein [Pseudomonadota bacterium]
MADITEALERLADLRDRGVLTSEEFDAQKAVLLGHPAEPDIPVPAAAPVAAPVPVPPPAAPARPASGITPGVPNVALGYIAPKQPGGSGGGRSSNFWLIVGCGAFLFLLVVVALWAAMGSKPRPTSTASTLTPYTSPTAPATSSAAPVAAPTTSPVAPSATVGDGGDNPLLGSWGADDGQANCPAMLTFKEATAIMTAADGTTKEVAMAYSVDSGESVVMFSPSSPTSRTTATITAGRFLSLSDASCRFHRS